MCGPVVFCAVCGPVPLRWGGFSAIIGAMLIAIGASVPDTRVTGFGSLAEAEAALGSDDVALVFTSPEILATVLGYVKDNRLSVPVIAVGPAQPATGAKAIRLGAVEYLTAPVEV